MFSPSNGLHPRTSVPMVDVQSFFDGKRINVVNEFSAHNVKFVKGKKHTHSNVSQSTGCSLLFQSRQVVGEVGSHLSRLSFYESSADGDAGDFQKRLASSQWFVGLSWKANRLTSPEQWKVTAESIPSAELWRHGSKSWKQPNIFPLCASNVLAGGKECRQLLIWSPIFTFFCGGPQHGQISPLLFFRPLLLTVPLALLKVPGMPEATK